MAWGGDQDYLPLNLNKPETTAKVTLQDFQDKVNSLEAQSYGVIKKKKKKIWFPWSHNAEVLLWKMYRELETDTRESPAQLFQS